MGLGFGTSNQNSTSYSGLRGTPQFAQFAVDYGNTSSQLARKTRQYANSPFGFFEGQSVDQFAPVSQYGLHPSLNSAMGSVANQMFSKASAGGALQGMVTPQNTEAIVGSSLNNIGSFLTPYIMDYAKYRMQLPEQLMASRLGFLQSTLGSMSPGLGSESKYSGSSFNLDTGLSANYGKQ